MDPKRFLLLPLLAALLLPAAAAAEGIAWVKVIPCPGSFDKFLSPRWSPDAKTLLATSTSSFDLFLLDPASRTSRALKTGSGTGVGAVWARDGRWVVYRKEDHMTGEREVAAIEVATGKTRILFTTREPLSLLWRAPDGAVSVFAGGRERSWAPRTGAEAVTDGATVPFLRVFDACSSPKGDRLAFTCDAGLFLLDRATGECIKIVYRGDDGWPSDPRFSPDGGSLVFVAPKDGVDSLYILPIPDGLPNERGTGMSPRWTAEGKVVFCLPEKNPGAREAKASELLLLDPCAAPRRRFTLLTDTANRLEGALDLSPDGIMLACEDRKSGDLLIGRLPPTR